MVWASEEEGFSLAVQLLEQLFVEFLPSSAAASSLVLTCA